jgi:phospholipid-transporting ATPase
MSVIVEDEGVIKLFIKGADSIIKSRLRPPHLQPYLKYIDKRLD